MTESELRARRAARGMADPLNRLRAYGAKQEPIVEDVTMNDQAIHQAFLAAAIECAKQGASAKQLAAYLEQAAKGMRVNAAFALAGDDLAAAMLPEMESGT